MYACCNFKPQLLSNLIFNILCDTPDAVDFTISTDVSVVGLVVPIPTLFVVLIVIAGGIVVLFPDCKCILLLPLKIISFNSKKPIGTLAIVSRVKPESVVPANKNPAPEVAIILSLNIEPLTSNL